MPFKAPNAKRSTISASEQLWRISWIFITIYYWVHLVMPASSLIIMSIILQSLYGNYVVESALTWVVIIIQKVTSRPQKPPTSFITEDFATSFGLLCRASCDNNEHIFSCWNWLWAFCTTTHNHGRGLLHHRKTLPVCVVLNSVIEAFDSSARRSNHVNVKVIIIKYNACLALIGEWRLLEPEADSWLHCKKRVDFSASLLFILEMRQWTNLICNSATTQRCPALR